MEEEWKNIEGYEGLYSVSNTGKIKTKKRMGTSGGLLKQRILKDGTKRPYVDLCKNSETTRKYVSRLVAEAFIENKENKPFVLHKDDNPQNNIVTNLYWGDKIDNNRDRKNNKHTHMNEGENCGTSKLTNKKVKEIRKRVKEEDITYKELGEEYNVHAETIYEVVARRTWKHI